MSRIVAIAGSAVYLNAFHSVTAIHSSTYVVNIATQGAITSDVNSATNLLSAKSC